MIIVVVIFQEELRQFFEKIAVWSLRSKREPPLEAEAAQVLVRTAADLAKERVGALTVAVAFWYVFVPGSKIVQATYKIPVEVRNLSPEFELQSVQPAEVEATLSGPSRPFYLFQASKLRVTVDASLADLGRRTFNISEQDVRHPKEINVEELNPSTLKISVRRLAREDKAAPG